MTLKLCVPASKMCLSFVMDGVYTWLLKDKKIPRSRSCCSINDIGFWSPSWGTVVCCLTSSFEGAKALLISKGGRFCKDVTQRSEYFLKTSSIIFSDHLWNCDSCGNSTLDYSTKLWEAFHELKTQCNTPMRRLHPWVCEIGDLHVHFKLTYIAGFKHEWSRTVKSLCCQRCVQNVLKQAKDTALRYRRKGNIDRVLSLSFTWSLYTAKRWNMPLVYIGAHAVHSPCCFGNAVLFHLAPAVGHFPFVDYNRL